MKLKQFNFGKQYLFHNNLFSLYSTFAIFADILIVLK